MEKGAGARDFVSSAGVHLDLGAAVLPVVGESRRSVHFALVDLVAPRRPSRAPPRRGRRRRRRPRPRPRRRRQEARPRQAHRGPPAGAELQPVRLPAQAPAPGPRRRPPPRVRRRQPLRRCPRLPRLRGRPRPRRLRRREQEALLRPALLHLPRRRRALRQPPGHDRRAPGEARLHPPGDHRRRRHRPLVHLGPPLALTRSASFTIARSGRLTMAEDR